MHLHHLHHLHHVDWSRYWSTAPGLELLLTDLPVGEAWTAYDYLAARRMERVHALVVLLGSNGVDMNTTDESLQRLNTWFVRHVEESAEDPGRLSSSWYSVVNDISLYLGEQLIGRTGSLGWVFDGIDGSDAERAREWGHPGLVVGPMADERGSYSVELDRLIAEYAHSVVTGHHVEPDYFLKILLAGIGSVLFARAAPGKGMPLL